MGLACLQVQPACQTLQTLPQGFCVCAQGLRQPLPEGGEGGGPPGDIRGKGKRDLTGVKQQRREQRGVGPGKDDTREKDRGPPGRHRGDRAAGSLMAVRCSPPLGTPCAIPPASQRRHGPGSCVQHPGWGTNVPLGPTPRAWQTRRRP